MKQLFFEIGFEEMPAGYLLDLEMQIKHLITKKLESDRLGYDSSSIQTGSTPRRVWILIEQMDETQKIQEKEVVGAPVRIAYDSEGELSAAGIKFIQKNNISKDDIIIKKTDKGDYISTIIKLESQPTINLLPEILKTAVLELSFKKSMRWGDRKIKFGRPIKHFLALFDEKIIPFEIDGITSGNSTYGHRFLGEKNITVKNSQEYFTKMNENSVSVSFQERKESIITQVKELVDTHQGYFSHYKGVEAILDNQLLDEVANLVEKPFVVLGCFDESFLELPNQVLITSLKNHQRYFVLKDENNRLINYFIGISNMPLTPESTDNIIGGYERVLNARLYDAMFFYKNDTQKTLDQFGEGLKDVVYQDKLGTYQDKVDRIAKLSLDIISKGYIDASKDITLRIAEICKADLLTEMVFEFTELQGYIGWKYAIEQNENSTVAKAINDHYKPRYSGDELPESHEASVIAIADKLDSVVGNFAIGSIPTGSEDPFSLRRSVNGIIQIILHNKYRVDIDTLIKLSLDKFDFVVDEDKDAIIKDVKQFLVVRLKSFATSADIAAGAFEAVVNTSSDPIIIVELAEILTQKRENKSFISIIASFKRINNILKKAKHNESSYDGSLLITPEEKQLAKLIETFETKIFNDISSKQFQSALESILLFAEPTNLFFDNVMVNIDDEKIKNNRLSLLHRLKDIYNSIGNLELL